MQVTNLQKSDFKWAIEPRDFLSRVELKKNGYGGIKETVIDADLVVSPIDISRLIDYKDLRDKNADISIKITSMPVTDLNALLVSIPNEKGEKVYSDAVITRYSITHDGIFNYQTFAQVSKMMSLENLTLLFQHNDFTGVNNAEACIINFRQGNTKLVGFYIPPIVEELPKEDIATPLENLRRRADRAPIFTLPSFDGAEREIDLREVIKVWEDILRNPSISTMPVLRDGMHRVSNANRIGASQHGIMINGSHAMAPSTPIHTHFIFQTATKPEKREDRFLGLSDSGWVDEKFVGIDG